MFRRTSFFPLAFACFLFDFLFVLFPDSSPASRFFFCYVHPKVRNLVAFKIAQVGDRGIFSQFALAGPREKRLLSINGGRIWLLPLQRRFRLPLHLPPVLWPLLFLPRCTIAQLDQKGVSPLIAADQNTSAQGERQVLFSYYFRNSFLMTLAWHRSLRNRWATRASWRSPSLSGGRTELHAPFQI